METMTKQAIAQALDEIAVLLELKGENPFKIRAYTNGARIVKGVETDLETFIADARAKKVKGIGDALAEKIETLYRTRQLDYLDELRAEFPDGLTDLLRIPGLGAKKVKALYEQLDVTNIGELEYACRENHLVDLPGFGKKTQENILAGILRIASYSGRFRQPAARKAAQRIADALAATGACERIEVAGSIRRRLETSKDIDVLVVSETPEPVMDAFCGLPDVKQITGRGETKASIVLEIGIAADLRVVPAESLAAALMYFTGSKEHNTAVRGIAKKKGYKLNEYGLFQGDKAQKAESEEAIYKKLGLAYVEPELREDRGEIEAAAEGALPALVTAEDLRGVLHAHSNYSDGSTSIAEMAEAVRRMGYDYLGISDHSQSAAYAGGLTPDDVKRQHEEIDRLNEKLAPFRIFKGIESDILAGGELDYDEKTLAAFDFVIASVHSSFKLPEKEMTARIVRAIQHPATRILGHPTGRLILSRDEYAVDVPALLDAAAEAQTAIELNANPYRLDLDWRYHRRAAALGIPIPISPDAHAIEGLSDMIDYGVGIARKGWLTAADVLNCRTADALDAFFRRETR